MSSGRPPVRHAECLVRPTVTASRLCAIGLLMLFTVGCSTWRAPASIDDTAWRTRAVNEELQRVRVSAAVLSADDSRHLFGADVDSTSIQPVWVEVENGGDDMLWLLRAGTDPDYFSPLEVAWGFHAPLGGARNRSIDDHFNQRAFHNPIPAGATRSGVIFTNPHRRTRLLNVDLLGRHRMLPFTLFLPVPDDPPDVEALRIVQRHAMGHHPNYLDDHAFRAALEQLPCCANAIDGSPGGEPVNVILVGTFADMGAAMQRRGYRSDRQPIDDQQRLFGRPPDIVARRSGQGRAPAHWLRAWVAPLRYQGKPVFMAQVARPVAGRFAAPGDGGPMHPQVDEARNLFLQDMLYSGGLVSFGFVSAPGEPDQGASPSESTVTVHVSDGLRVVMFFVPRPLALSDVEVLDWEPFQQHRESMPAQE